MTCMEHGEGERRRTAGLIALLIGDVIAAQARPLDGKHQSNRRDFVRAVLAALEGIIWELRGHVASALSHCDALTPVIDLALRETGYAVTADGRIHERSQGLPLTTATRLAVTQAQAISPSIDIDFGASGWASLIKSVAVRNRITHPKTVADLTVTSSELIAAERALKWVVAMTDYTMSATNLALTRYNELARELVQKLKDGDPDTLAEYKAILEEDLDGNDRR